jgi:hypothetical protein
MPLPVLSFTNSDIKAIWDVVRRNRKGDNSLS